jgi:hypothetical protein
MSPVKNKSIAVNIPGHTYIHGIGSPSKQALSPSMTPTIGLREYTMRYFSGIDDAEYTIGAVYMSI